MEISHPFPAQADAKIFKPLRDATKRGPLGTRADLLAFRDEPDLFWKTALRDLAASTGKGALSDKARAVLLARLRGFASHAAGAKGRGGAPSPRSPSAPSPRSAPKSKGPPVPGWLELKKGWRAYLSDSGVLYLFDDAPFAPWDDGAPVRVDAKKQQAAAQPFGSWDVLAYEDSDDDDDADDDDDRRAALDRFFDTGAFTYAVDKPRDAPLRLTQAGLRKYKPIQRLDDLTASNKLRSCVPVAAPRPGDTDKDADTAAADCVRVRVATSFKKRA